MSYRVGVGSIFKKKNKLNDFDYYQIVSGSTLLGRHDELTYIGDGPFIDIVIEVCLLTIDYTYTTLQPCMSSSKSCYEYKHYKLKKNENYNNFRYKGYLKLEDFFIDNWNEIKNDHDLHNAFHEWWKCYDYDIPIVLDNNLFLKPIISKKVSHTYYDTIEKKNKTIKIK
jgi:hypothetical protein